MKRKCRFCSKLLNKIFVDLGKTPLSNSFVSKEDLNKKEIIYPLIVYVCEECFLVQIPEFETPKKIFSEYAYFSSYSSSWLEHTKNYVEMILNGFNLNEKSLVVELASNDGYLLQYFMKNQIPVLGIEPAKNVARKAKNKGIPTVINFFSEDLARKLKNDGKQADLIIANNVLAHVPDLNKFVNGIKILLKPDGVTTIEFPHLLNLIEKNQFDIIYHEHYSYFSLLTAQKIFSRHKLKIFDVEEIPTQGGSLRLYVKHEANNLKISSNVNIVIEKEKQCGLENVVTYMNFSQKVNATKKLICDFFLKAKNSGKKIVCYGAPAKGNTLLNFCNIDLDFIEYTVDRNPYKQGLYLPGTHIPIKNPDEIRKTKPDYLVILPWNLKDEIICQMGYIRDWGGKFVILIPKVTIYS